MVIAKTSVFYFILEKLSLVRPGQVSATPKTRQRAKLPTYSIDTRLATRDQPSFYLLTPSSFYCPSKTVLDLCSSGPLISEPYYLPHTVHSSVVALRRLPINTLQSRPLLSVALYLVLKRQLHLREHHPRIALLGPLALRARLYLSKRFLCTPFGKSLVHLPCLGLLSPRSPLHTNVQPSSLYTMC